MDKIKDIVAVMATKKHPEEEVGSLTVAGKSSEGLLMKFIPSEEVEVLTEHNFEEPKRQNFEDFVKGIMSGESPIEPGVEVKFLSVFNTECSIDLTDWLPSEEQTRFQQRLAGEKVIPWNRPSYGIEYMVSERIAAIEKSVFCFIRSESKKDAPLDKFLMRLLSDGTHNLATYVHNKEYDALLTELDMFNSDLKRLLVPTNGYSNELISIKRDVELAIMIMRSADEE